MRSVVRRTRFEVLPNGRVRKVQERPKVVRTPHARHVAWAALLEGGWQASTLAGVVGVSRQAVSRAIQRLESLIN